MDEFNFKSFLKKACLQYADQRLIFDTKEQDSLSYAEAFELIQITANRLSAEGLKKGDNIIHYMPLSIESVVLCWACLYQGIVFIPVDHNWPSELLEQVLEETRPKLILTDNERAPFFDKVKSCIILQADADEPNVRFFDWLQNENSEPMDGEYEVAGSDLAVILYTSGSTGKPKGVQLSQKALFNSGRLIANHFEWQLKDVFMNLGDLHSMSGLRNTCISPLHVGASCVLASLDERNNVVKLYDVIHQRKVNYLGVAPTVIRQMNILFSTERSKKLASLKAILCTGGPLAKDQLELYYHNHKIPVLNYYGLTETAGICTGHNLNTFSPLDNSIGPAVGAELIIVPDPDFTEEGVGELLVKSDNLMIGYYKRELETSTVLIDGCFSTGDIVRKRADGCIELISRKRNIIKNLHSELIYLEEVDAALESISCLSDASTCAYSKTEEDEKIVAFVVPNNNDANQQEIIDQIKSELILKLGKNRMPWCYYIESALPRNSFGKIQRQLLNPKINDYIKTNRTRYF